MDTTGRTWTLGLLALGTVLAARAADNTGLTDDKRVAWRASSVSMADWLVSHPKRLLGLASEARLAGYDQPPHAAFRAVVLRRDVGAPRPVVHPVCVFPEDVLDVLQLRVPRAPPGQLHDPGLDRLGLAGEVPWRKTP